MYYAVRSGFTPGIYNSWSECQKNINKFKGAEFKKFNLYEDALVFMNSDKVILDDTSVEDIDKIIDNPNNNFAFVDGSVNKDTMVYGCGIVFRVNGEYFRLKQSGSNEKMKSMMSLAGELLGATLAMKHAVNLGLKELYLFYDNMGIEQYAKGVYTRRHYPVEAYYKYYNSISKDINIIFKKVRAHSKIKYNEEADVLSKQAVGILNENGTRISK